MATGKKHPIRLTMPVRASLLAALIAGLYAASVIHVPQVRLARNKFEDRLFRWRMEHNRVMARNASVNRDIVLIAIDEESYKRMSRMWPWSRQLVTELLGKISQYDPKVIALDFALYGSNSNDPEGDVALAEALRRSGRVILASAFGKERQYLGPAKMFVESSMGYGGIGASPDNLDGLIRQVWTRMVTLAPEKPVDVAFELKVASSYLDVPYDNFRHEGSALVLGSDYTKLEIPVDDDGKIRINYTLDEDVLNVVPVWRVMEDDVPPSLLKDRLVLVSATGEIFHDIHPTPIGRIAGGVIIANTLRTILESSYISEVPPAVGMSVLALLYILLCAVFYKRHALVGLLVLLCVIAVTLFLTGILFIDNILWPAFDFLVSISLLYLGITLFRSGLFLYEGFQVRKMASTDMLTQLHTHRYFRFLLEHEVKKAASSRHRGSLLFFKVINLDRIVKEISFDTGQRVQRLIGEAVRKKFTASLSAYLGAGEFAIFLAGTSLNSALGAAGSFRDTLTSADYRISDEEHRPAFAVGVAGIERTFPKTSADLMRCVRIAMRRAAELGRNKICRFNPKIDVSVFDSHSLEREIRHSIDGEFGFLAVDLEQRNKELEDLLRELSMTQRELEAAHFETLRALVAAIEQKDPTTAGHSERVGKVAEKVGRVLKLSDDELNMLKQSAILHDIGKVGIPQDILRKEDRLNIAERHLVELHPEFSVRILSASKYFNQLLDVIRDHHERLDGSGYPRGLRHGQISTAAQIIAVCDVFDALTTDRPYRKAMPYKDALDELVSHPEWYNQRIVLALIQVLKNSNML